MNKILECKDLEKIEPYFIDIYNFGFSVINNECKINNLFFEFELNSFISIENHICDLIQTYPLGINITINDKETNTKYELYRCRVQNILLNHFNRNYNNRRTIRIEFSIDNFKTFLCK